MHARKQRDAKKIRTLAGDKRRMKRRKENISQMGKRVMVCLCVVP